MKSQINVTKITVLVRKGETDIVYFNAELTTPFPEMDYSASLKMEAKKGYGVKWVKENFGVEPFVITVEE